MTSASASQGLDLAVERIQSGVTPPPGLVDLIVSAGTSAQLQTVARCCPLTEAQLGRLFDVDDAEIDVALGRRSDLTAAHVDMLAGRGHPTVLGLLASSPFCPYLLRPQLIARFLAAPAATQHGPYRDARRALAQQLGADHGLRAAVAQQAGWVAVVGLLDDPQTLTAAEVHHLAAELAAHSPSERDESRATAAVTLRNVLRQRPELPRVDGDTSPAGSQVELAGLSAAELTGLRRWPCDPLAVLDLPYRQLEQPGSAMWSSVVLAGLYEMLGDDLHAWQSAAALVDDLDADLPVRELLATARRLSRG